jgi:membrane-bound lytic murein transglycosylase D
MVLEIPQASDDLPEKVLLAAARVDRPASDTGGRKQSQIVYRVRAGDTLSKIAQRQGVSVNSLARLNNLGPGDSVLRGQRLVIKTTSHSFRNEGEVSSRRIAYTVRQGDTVFSISKQFQVSIDQLKTWNGLNKNHQIRTGQRLVMYVEPHRAHG